MLEQIKARILELEEHLKQLVQSHTTASGQLAEARIMQEMAEKAAEQPEIEAAEVVDNAVEEAQVIAE